ncbi:toxin [Streptomyces sp. NRRL F-4489]|uniref:DUF397 domain-containing protein n=1 Tax=Streptomyces sp. NRRL F-4489 TaxID=1609095 RepID=UPI00074A75DD|nr:DUF397 domain-containing protein [Streptomyces sp. NRRL F-4489]KUL36486.1 toxin [Streptomyces sp. NRRL F-4489]
MREYNLSNAQWYKSSYSDGHGGDCVEVARWRKSSYSGHNNDECLEVRDDLPGIVPVRDSKNPDGPALVFPAEGWTSFVGAVKNDRFTGA